MKDSFIVFIEFVSVSSPVSVYNHMGLSGLLSGYGSLVPVQVFRYDNVPRGSHLS